MEIMRIGSQATAFIRPKEGANAGLVHTPRGMILIDTTSSPAEIQDLLQAANVHPQEVRLVVNTHFHSDHTWGNQLFACPILAHRACQQRMNSALQGDWSPGELQAALAEEEKTNPAKAEAFRQVLANLHIKPPDEVFDERFVGELGGIRYEVIHFGGHSPDLSVVWLPGIKLLYASDLIFQGRYPYIFDADIPAWLAALDRLLEFEAQVIIPGHGVSCGAAEILQLRAYLQCTWEMTAEHLGLGHSVEETCADPAFPIFPGEKYERLHQANIRYMYTKLGE